jgi:protein-tyrosine phosphatase
MNTKYNKILPHLWLGNYKAAYDINFIEKNNITAIINCTVSFPFIEHENIKYKYRFPILDNNEEEQIELMYLSLTNAADLIHSLIESGNNILVHCYAGKQRSPTILLSYILKYWDVDLNKAIETVQIICPFIYKPKFNFKVALEKWYNELNL